MSSKTDWRPSQYLRFQRERTQPAVDLARRVDGGAPSRILDLGCGPGNSTAVLASMWPEAAIVGVDSSEAMLETARATSERVQWVHCDASGDMSDLGRFDLVFSNAALQWIPDTAALLPRLFAMLNPGGALAVQVPCNRELPAFAALVSVAHSPKWQVHLSNPDLVRLHHSHQYYYDILSALPGETAMWRTDYIHIMDSHDAIVEWYKGAGLRPFLNVLPSPLWQDSLAADFAEALRAVYPVSRDGTVLFPFTRLFFIKHRPAS